MARSVWTRAAALVLVLSVAPGCGVDGVPPLRPVPVAPGQTLTALDRDDFADAGCSVTVGGDEALRAHVEAAAERWSAATGCQIAWSDEQSASARFVLVAHVLRPDGSEAPAKTSADRTRVEVSELTGEPQRASTVLHELGHVLGANHVEGGGVLSGDKHRSDVIDEPALLAVCAPLPCAHITPE